MNDIHTERSSPGRIPVLSPTIHCAAMTALVFLRSGFGFVFLRPKSVFFAFSWAFILFAIFAWNELYWWREYRAVCLFGMAAIAFYWLHLAITISREFRQTGAHDHYSGTSHALLLIRLFGISKEHAELRVHLWIEPALVLMISATLRVVFSERHLSVWLAIVALCMFCKEFMNYWYGEIRRQKIGKDMAGDAQRQGESLSDSGIPTGPPKATRKEGVRLKRNTGFAEEAEREERFAKLLRLRPPYTLEKAEENYKALVQLEHPDANRNSPESNAATAELNEAISFFRDRLGS
jgi:hypothetical protein